MSYLKDARRIQSALIEKAIENWNSPKHRSGNSKKFIPEADIWSVNGWIIRTWLNQLGVMHQRKGYPNTDQNEFQIILDCYFKQDGNPGVWTAFFHGNRNDVLVKIVQSEHGIDEAIEAIQTHIQGYSTE